MGYKFEGVALAEELGIDEFTLHYIGAALQLSDEEIGKDATISDLPAETLAAMKEDCTRFQARCGYELEWMPQAQAGTDFWLTRNGHGAGYWDREEVYGIEGARFLTESAEAFGQAYLYKGDDGLIYQFS